MAIDGRPSSPMKGKLAMKRPRQDADAGVGKALSDLIIGTAADFVQDTLQDVVGDTVTDVVGSGTAGGILGGIAGFLTGSQTDNIFSKIFKSDPGDFYTGPAAVLRGTDGLVFPNTPTIQTSQTADWEDFGLPHTNYPQLAYKNSRPNDIIITAKFTSNTLAEANYTVGAIHFLRTVTKMHYGIKDDHAGTPPPILEFSALGPWLFDRVPVVVTNFSTTFEDSYNYVPSTSVTFVPTITVLTLELRVYYNAIDQITQFSLEDFQSGAALGRGFI